MYESLGLCRCEVGVAELGPESQSQWMKSTAGEDGGRAPHYGEPGATPQHPTSALERRKVM